MLLQQKNTNFPFKIYLNFQILITGNVNYILVQTSVADLLKYMLMGTTNKIPWLFPDFDSKIQTSLICNKIPHFPDSDRLKFPWLFPDCGNPELITVATLNLLSTLGKGAPDCNIINHLNLYHFWMDRKKHHQNIAKQPSCMSATKSERLP